MKHIYLMTTLFLLFLGCNKSNNSNPNPPQPTDNQSWTENIGVDDGLNIYSSINATLKETISNSSGNTNNQDISTFLPDSVNSAVKITGTERHILVSQEYISADLTTLPAELPIVIIQPSPQDNEDIQFNGELIMVEKSLINDIKQALASDPKEIAQTTVDGKKASGGLGFDLTFTVTLYKTEKGYWQPSETDDFDYNDQKMAIVDGTATSLLMVLNSDLNANSDDLPDRVRALFLSATLNEASNTLEMTIEFILVPKSVVGTIKAHTDPNVPVSIPRDDTQWLRLVSFTMSLSFSSVGS